MNKVRKQYLDSLRVFASMLVVLLHSAAQGFRRTPIGSIDWWAMNIYDSLARIGVPIFFMISGALFLSKDVSKQSIIVKYVKRIVIVFYSWSLIYFISNYFFTKDFNNSIPIFLFGDSHMWYLLATIGL